MSATIKQSSKNTFINTITIARKEYMTELRKAVEEFCVTAERNDNDKLNLKHSPFKKNKICRTQSP